MIDRYSRKELRALWSDQRRYDVWLDVELAACTAMEREGSVPAGTAARVREKAAGKLDAARILEIEERTRHDVIAFLTHVEELAGADARWLHLGMTSSDVLDSSLANNRAQLAKSALDRVLGRGGRVLVATSRGTPIFTIESGRVRNEPSRNEQLSFTFPALQRELQ